MIFYNLIVSPIEIVIEWIFLFGYNLLKLNNSAFSIILVSIFINLITLPLYINAEALQKKERELQKSMEYRIKRIKKAFRGDEQFMMLQTYYRQNNYHPLYALRSSLSILIEVPFFIAAYHYLINCSYLNEQTFLFIKDLGSPDALINFSLGSKNIVLNLLPIIMTIINLLSGLIYSRKCLLREKLQIYCLAVIFLILLYKSPAGLVLYWTLNNIFSLIKNVLYERQFIKKIKEKTVVLISRIIKNQPDNSFRLFLLSSICFTLLCGLVLPSSVIATSPIEFSFIGNTENPVNYIFSTIIIFSGLFLLWPCVIYKIMGHKVKGLLEVFSFVIFISTLINSFVFQIDGLQLDMFFQIDGDDENISLIYKLLPLVVFVSLIIVYCIIRRTKIKKYLPVLFLSICFAEITFSGYKLIKINSIHNDYKKNLTKNNAFQVKNQTFYHLSKDKKNVVFIFLDRAVNEFFPRFLSEFPELVNKYDGFTYYPNALSFGDSTEKGSPAMMGGYDYTPYNINLRADEPLVKKHNEATLVLPKLFLDAGFNVYVTDPPWPNYSWKGDLTPFEAFPKINVTEFAGKFTHQYAIEKGIQLSENLDNLCRKNLNNFIVYECVFPVLRNKFYKLYLRKVSVSTTFYNDLSVLYYLPEITDFESDKATYTFIGNETTHSMEQLNPPYYDRKTKVFENLSDKEIQYHTNAAAYLTIAKWLDYLRENDCYDNTRIIIVSDHSYNLKLEDFIDVNKKVPFAEGLNCILLFKDFDSNAPVITDEQIMTNADAFVLAKKDLPLSNINPFTGKEFVNEKKDGITIYKVTSFPINKKIRKLLISYDEEYFVTGDIKNPDSWTKIIKDE